MCCMWRMDVLQQLEVKDGCIATVVVLGSGKQEGGLVEQTRGLKSECR